MNVLVVITDGRQPQTISETLESAQIKLRGEFDKTFIINDSANDEYADWLANSYPSFHIVNHETRRGLGGAVRSAWETALNAGADYVFHLEDDFRFDRKVKIDKMIQLLHCERHLAQVSLKRQPVNDVEERAGGFMQLWPVGTYTERQCETGKWVEHQSLFTFNPCVIPRRAMEPALSTDGLERGVTDILLQHGYSFGVLGTVEDEPRVHHLGTHRSSGWSV